MSGGVFDDVIKKIYEKDLNKKPVELVAVDFSQNPAINLNYAKSMIVEHLDELSDRELYDLLRKAYSILLEDIFVRDDKSYLEVIINSKLITQFIQVINSVELTYMESIYCNKLAYDYLTMIDDDEYMKGLLLSLSKVVNRKKINELVMVNIPDDIATFLVMARYSSTKEYVNVRRLNHSAMMFSASIMTPQTMVNIYDRLFETEFTPLFEGTMFDPYERETLRNMSDDASEIYSNISLAIFGILEQQESTTIRKVLLSYAGNYQVSRENTEVRFPIKSLSISDYSRILHVVESMAINEMIIVP